MSIKDENNFDDVKSITLPEKTKPVWYYQMLEWPIISKVLDVKYWFIGLWEKLTRIWDYAKFGFSNPDFDHMYLIDILEFKLKRMKNEFETSKYHDHTEIIKEVNFVLDLIEKYRHGTFTEEEEKEHKKKFGECKSEFEKLPDGNYLWLSHYEKDGVLYKDGTDHVKAASEASLEIYKLNERKRKECLHKIMYYIAENMEKWWD